MPHRHVGQVASLEVEGGSPSASRDLRVLAAGQAHPAATRVGLASISQFPSQHQQFGAVHRAGKQGFARCQAQQADLLGIAREQRTYLARLMSAPGRRGAGIYTHAAILARRHLPELDEDNGPLTAGGLMA